MNKSWSEDERKRFYEAFLEYIISLSDPAMQEKNAKKMFKNLRKHKGEEVSYSGWWYGKINDGKGKLIEVNDFVNVEIGNMGLPFVGYGAAICSIISKDGDILYENPFIEEYYDRRQDDKIYDSKRLIFGDKVVLKQKLRREQQEREWEEYTKKSDEAAKRSKSRLMKEGLSLIKPELSDEWIEFTNNNCNDGYSVGVVKATVSMMKKFEEGVSFEEAEQQVYGDELGLSGFQSGCAASALSKFSKQGDQYRVYWNKQYGIDDEETKGVVNPAILVKKK